MTKEQIAGLIRTILAYIAGVATAKGWIDESMVEPIIGAVIALVTAVWSFVAKKEAKTE